MTSPAVSFRLTPLEVASGLVFGFGPPHAVPVTGGLEVATPVEALEDTILPALLRPPCVMSFTGGYGSSLVLAVAVQLARRERLELPVPATVRLRGSVDADELAAQERVVIRLGLTEWIRLELEEKEFDLVGPAAAAVLRGHGFLWPPDAHLWTPLLDWAFGGSLLTGIGYTSAPDAPPTFVYRDLRPPPWLQPSARRELRLLSTADAAGRRQRAQRELGWWLTLREVRIRIDLLRRLAAGRRVEVCTPLLDQRFLAGLGTPRSRFETVAVLEGLPRTASTHAPFAAALWGEASRELAAGWQGEAVDQDLVDVEALSHHWSLPKPDPRTYLLLQSVALAREQRAAGEVATTAAM